MNLRHSNSPHASCILQITPTTHHHSYLELSASNMAPRVHHFIVRPEVVKRLPTGLAVEQALVPLIPLDELPEWLDRTV